MTSSVNEEIVYNIDNKNQLINEIDSVGHYNENSPLYSKYTDNKNISK